MFSGVVGGVGSQKLGGLRNQPTEDTINSMLPPFINNDPIVTI